MISERHYIYSDFSKIKKILDLDKILSRVYIPDVLLYTIYILINHYSLALSYFVTQGYIINPVMFICRLIFPLYSFITG